MGCVVLVYWCVGGEWCGSVSGFGLCVCGFMGVCTVCVYMMCVCMGGMDALVCG